MPLSYYLCNATNFFFFSSMWLILNLAGFLRPPVSIFLIVLNLFLWMFAFVSVFLHVHLLGCWYNGIRWITGLNDPACWLSTLPAHHQHILQPTDSVQSDSLLLDFSDLLFSSVSFSVFSLSFHLSFQLFSSLAVHYLFCLYFSFLFFTMGSEKFNPYALVCFHGKFKLAWLR